MSKLAEAFTLIVLHIYALFRNSSYGKIKLIVCESLSVTDEAKISINSIVEGSGCEINFFF